MSSPCIPRARALGFTAFLLLSGMSAPPMAWTQDLAPAEPASGTVGFLMSAGAFAVAFWLLGAFRLHLLTRYHGLVFSFPFLLQTWVVGDALNRLLPFQGVGDAYKFAQVGRVSRAPSRAAISVLSERLLGLVSLVIVLAIAFPLCTLILGVTWAKSSLAVVLVLLGATVAIVLIVAVRPRLLPTLASLLFFPPRVCAAFNVAADAMRDAWQDRRRLVTIVAVGIGMQLASIAVVASVFLALQSPGSDTALVVAVAPLAQYDVIVGRITSPSGASGLYAAYEEITALSGMSFSLRELIARQLWLLVIPLGIAFLWQLLRVIARRSESVEVSPLRSHEEGGGIDSGDVRDLRRTVLHSLAAGVGGGVVAGALIGLSEAVWVANRGLLFSESRLMWWGPLFYGLLLWVCGLGVAMVATFLCIAFERATRPIAVFSISLGGTLTACIVVFGRYRYGRDNLGEALLSGPQIALLLGIALAVGSVVALGVFAIFRRVRLTWRAGTAVTLAAYVAIVLSGALVGVFWPAQGRAVVAPDGDPPDAPNVILVAVDTLRADYLSVYDEEADADTPRLAAFRDDAVLFESCYAQAPWTKPAFASIFTGLFPVEHGAIRKRSMLPSKVETIAETLLRNGFYTQGFPNNPNITAMHRFDQGFVHYDELEPDWPFWARRSVGRLAMYQFLKQARDRIFLPRIEISSHYQPGEEVSRVANGWLTERPDKGRPFFLFVHFMDPHDPYMLADEPNRGYGMGQLGIAPDPEKFGDLMHRGYVDEIERFDEHFGKFLDTLQAEGLYEDSLIVFVSDHGEEFQEHGGWWHGMTHYDEVLHVPLLIKLPGNQGAGGTNGHFARQVDIAPTILGVAGLEAGSEMSGVPLLDAQGAFLNGDIEQVYAESDFVGAAIRSLRAENMKLIRSKPGPRRALEPLELFDIEADPGEKENLVGTGRPDEDRLLEALRETRQKLIERARD